MDRVKEAGKSLSNLDLLISKIAQRENTDIARRLGELSANFSDANIVYKLMERWRYLILLRDLRAIYNDDDLTPDEKIVQYSRVFELLI